VPNRTLILRSNRVVKFVDPGGGGRWGYQLAFTKMCYKLCHCPTVAKREQGVPQRIETGIERHEETLEKIGHFV
jgi:hypothetical protein